MHMAQKAARYPAVSVVALAAAVIALYSLWGASLLRAQREAPYSTANSEVQVARN